MKKVFTTLLFIMAVVLACAAKTEPAKVVFAVQPAMTCQNCENKIKTNIRYEKGVSDIVTDLKTQTVTVTYDPAKTTPAKLTEAFKKIGYTVTVAQPACPPAAASCGSCGGCGHHHR